ncbi:hypothetical protein [Streptomyces sp. KAU_LT]|uniref:hypothetical protein n=1 Tax=Streptomyces sp. KAU_LT TaxID=3046669 RepID=UPI0024B77A46|nr:hypothetical protein [Streptomyces sp. KAU_LT]MDI9829690.1 hypothetical protein [Streptomyces sp. KAU_LT]
MSGCCGQGPVIVSGAAAAPRLDVETQLMCDVLPDGTVAATVLVEPIYDTSTGERVATRITDPATGDVYAPVGEIQVCPTSPDCESPTTPVTSVGLCLADGTPIAVTVIRDCTGATTAEGWINLVTGVWSAGAVPAGAVACGDSQSIQVSGTFCDVDEATGDVLGLVLVEYTYDDTGAIASVRLVDAVTGGTYTPTGTVTVCPAGVAQPERDLLQLCDTATDGTVTAFVRDYARDENGAIVGHSDYDLDGAPYTPTGTVGVCGGTEGCRDTSTVLVCDVPADSSTAITPTIVDGTLADVGQTQFQTHPGPWAPLWSGGTLVYPAGAGPTQEHLGVVGQITADMADCDGASGTLTISVRVRNDGPTAGQAWDGALRLFRGTTAIATHNALEWAPVGWQGTLTVSAPVTAADIAAGDIRVALLLETYHLGAKSWTADQFTATLELEGCEVTTSTQFLRTLVTDCETGEVVSTTDTTLDGQPYTVTGEVGQCTPAETPSECRECDSIALCDVAEDGTSTSFLRTICRDCTGAVISVLDTELSGTAPYAVTGTVGRCCDTQVLAECTYSLPDTSTALSLTDPAYPGCWLGTGGAASYTYGDRVTSWAATYQSDTGSASVALFSSPELGGAINFTAFAPALPVNPAQSAAGYVGTAVINGITVTLTATGGNGLGIWQANPTGLYLGGDDAFRLDFSEPVQLTVNASGFADPATLHERFCGVTALTVPWPALRLADCDGNVTVVDPDTREPIPAGAVVTCQASDCETTAVQTIRLCDLDPGVEPDEDGRRCAVPFLRHLAYDCAGELAGFHDTALDGTTPYTPVQVVDCQCETGEGLTSSIEVPWQVVDVVEDPAGVTGQDFIYTVAPENDPTRIGTIRVHVSRPAGGACGAYDIDNLVFSNTAAYTLTLDAVAQEMSYLRVDLLDFDTFEPVAVNTAYPLPNRLGGTAGWNATNTRIVPSENNGTGYMYWDNPPATVGWSVLNQGGGVSCSALSFQGMTVEPGGCCGGDSSTSCGDTEITPLCDLVAAPGTPTPVPADSFALTGNVVVIGDTLQFSRNNVPANGVAERAVTGLISGAASSLTFDAGWGGGGNPPATNDAIYRADILDGATVLATSTVNLSNGSGSAGAVVAQSPLAFTAPPSGNVTVRFTDLSTGGALNRDLVIRPLTVETEGVQLTARPFLRAYTYDCAGLLLSTTDTELDGSTPYTPQGEVGVCSGTSATETTESGPVNTGVRSVTGIAAQDLATEFPDLQSVSLAVLAGAVNVTMTDGTDVSIPAGVTLTWSVSKDTDTALAAASFAGADPSASYLLNWTYLS